jgi:hypothetical protein
MSKLLLVLRPQEFTSFTSFYLENFWKTYFEIEYYNPATQYDRKSTLFAVRWVDAGDQYVQQLLNNNHKVISDALWDVQDNHVPQQIHLIKNKNWFWYNESLWWQSQGYHKYKPNKNIDKIGLMPIRRVSDTRDKIVQSLRPSLDQFIWSYRDQRLPDDNYNNQDVDQRYVNFDWYDRSYFSLVIETSQHDYIALTEKSYKPIAYYHPFVIVGVAGVLSELKANGFETFDNLFDESYDQMQDFDSRLSSIVSIVKNFDHTVYDQLTQQKLEHNHNLFFNTQLVTQRMVSEIVNPLLEYAEK